VRRSPAGGDRSADLLLVVREPFRQRGEEVERSSAPIITARDEQVTCCAKRNGMDHRLFTTATTAKGLTIFAIGFATSSVAMT